MKRLRDFIIAVATKRVAQLFPNGLGKIEQGAIGSKLSACTVDLTVAFSLSVSPRDKRARNPTTCGQCQSTELMRPIEVGKRR